MSKTKLNRRKFMHRKKSRKYGRDQCSRCGILLINKTEYEEGKCDQCQKKSYWR